MRNLSTAFKQALIDDDHSYLNFADITLLDETVLNLTNVELWSGGFSTEDSISEDENFTVLGSAIIGQANLKLNNIDDEFSAYDFKNAHAVLYTGMSFTEGTTTRLEKIKLGTYLIDDAVYNGSTISLILLDNMVQFDRPYSESSLIYPATLDTIIRDACTCCGVELASFTSTMTNFVISTRPNDESATFREIISWVATVAGCYARCNAHGKLELKWINSSLLSSIESSIDGGIFDNGTPYYESGDNADGGTFNPWNTGDVVDGGTFTDRDNLHHIYSLRSQHIAVDDTVITGVKISIRLDGSSGDIQTSVFPANASGALIELEGVPFITTDNVATIGSYLGTLIAGLTFRKVNISHSTDPSIEAGDIAYITDRKGNSYAIIVTRTNFSADGSQVTVCASQTPIRNGSTRFLQTTKDFVEYKRLLNEERSIREQLEDDLTEALAEHSGLYTTTETTQSGKIYYLHDLPDLDDSSIVWKMTKEAWGVTTDYNGDQTIWNAGMTVDGNTIVNILSATGISAGWINSGQLVIKDSNNVETLFIDAETGVVRVAPTVFTLTSANITTIQTQATSIANTAKADAISTAASDATSKANTAEQNAKDYSDWKLSAYQTVVSGIVDGLQDQIDGQIMSWYYDYEPTLNNVPANGWTTSDLKKEHEGDIFYWKSKGYAYRFLNDGTEQNPDWKWIQIQDTDISTAIGAAQDAQTTANSKRRIFTSQPTDADAYDVGDLWVNATYGTTYSNDILKCKTAKAVGATFAIANWELASKYTDDSGLQTWISSVYSTDKTTLQTQIDGKIQTWRQSEDPSFAWSDSTTKAKHVGDIWYCVPSEDIIPSWLLPYVGTESGMTALLSQRADDTWFSVANDVNFSIDGVVSTNIYIDSNSTFAFADTQPSTSGRNQAYNLNICRRDGQALSILNQLIEDGTHKAVKIKFSGYTEYSQSSQKPEYLNEYEVFFTNDNEIYINTIKQPTYAYASSSIDTSIKDNGVTVKFTLIANTHMSIKKENGSWITNDDRYFDKSWMYEEDNGVYYWADMSSGVPQELLDEVDGKSSIYTTASAPSTAEEGDLWFKSASDPIKTYHNGQWVEYNKYTDDTTALTVYGTCSTGSNTAAKVVTLSNFVLHTGSRVAIKFSNANTIADATLNVNSTGAKTIKAYGSNLTATSAYNWVAGAVVEFVYDGSYWQMVDGSALSKIGTLDSSLNQQEIFDRLTNNSANQGIFLENGNLYLNMTYAKTGTLIVGGSATSPGVIEVKDGNDVRIGRWDKTGLYIGNIASNLNNPYTKIDTVGRITTDSLTANNYVYVDGNELSYFKIPSGTDSYTELSSTGIILKSKYLYSRLSSPNWTYRSNYDRTEYSDYESDQLTRPGFYGINVGLKVSYSNTQYPSAYAAVGRDFFETGYNASVYSDSSSFRQYYARLNGYDQSLELNKITVNYSDGSWSGNALILKPTGFTHVFTSSYDYHPYSGSLTIGGTTYYVRGGILCDSRSAIN